MRQSGVYASRGFVAEGEPYDDGGIDHVTHAAARREWMGGASCTCNCPTGQT